MPVLSYKLANLEINGASVELSISPPRPVIQEYLRKKQAVPTKKIIGLIDTGATSTAIDSALAKELHLVARDQQVVFTPNGESKQNLYDILVSFDNMNIQIATQAFGAELSKQPYSALIGRDILRSCTLIYNGWNNSFDIHFHPEKIT